MKQFSTNELCCIQEAIGSKLSSLERKALDAMFYDNTLRVVNEVLHALKHNISTNLIAPCLVENDLNEAIQELVAEYRGE